MVFRGRALVSMFVLFMQLYLVKLSESTKATTEGRILCTKARAQCLTRLGCGMALQKFSIGCSTMLDDVSNQCTESCKYALVSLLSIKYDLGLAFINCDCEGDKNCIKIRQRVNVCAHDVLEAMRTIDDDTTVLGCTLARWICEVDNSCFTAFRYYLTHCRNLFKDKTSSRQCTDRCNNSLYVLYSQSKAKKLRTCQCEGSDIHMYNQGYDCQRIKDSTQQLCFRDRESYTVLSPITTPSPKNYEWSANNGGPSSAGKHAVPHSHLLVLYSLVLCFLLTRTLSRIILTSSDTYRL